MPESRKLQFQNSQYQLNIPKSLVNAKGWEKGDEILVKVNDEGKLEVWRKKE